MSDSRKPFSDRDYQQVLRGAFNDVDKSLTIGGFLVGRVGYKIELAISTTNVSDDTETYTFSDNGEQLYQLRIIYTDGSRELMLSAERIA